MRCPALFRRLVLSRSSPSTLEAERGKNSLASWLPPKVPTLSAMTSRSAIGRFRRSPSCSLPSIPVSRSSRSSLQGGVVPLRSLPWEAPDSIYVRGFEPSQLTMVLPRRGKAVSSLVEQVHSQGFSSTTVMQNESSVADSFCSWHTQKWNFSANWMFRSPCEALISPMVPEVSANALGPPAKSRTGWLKRLTNSVRNSNPVRSVM